MSPHMSPHFQRKIKMRIRCLSSLSGYIQAIQAPDIYGVVVEGERGSRPKILAQEEILRDAVLDLKPTGSHQLPPGTRLVSLLGGVCIGEKRILRRFGYRC